MMASAFSSNFVSSVEEFRALFASDSDDRLLLCYEPYHDGVAATDLMALEDAVRSAVTQHATKVRLHFWDCGSNAFVEAKEQLGKEQGTPLLAVLYRQTLADTLREPVSAMIRNMNRVCERLAAYQRGGKIAVLSSSLPPTASPHTATNDLCMSVDVSRLVGMGKRLMAEGKAEYAEKFFHRALATLDAVRSHCDGDVNVDGSTALCLAWVVLAQIVQGRNADAHMRRLEAEYAGFCEDAGSDAARVRATYRLVTAAPLTWRGDTCSQKKLRDVLDRDPQSHNHRCALVVTLFLAGDIERSLTEAVKLTVLHVPFGTTAISAIGEFIGRDHALMQTIGADRERPSTGV
ncbi:hypothetical protein TraAM80_08099 [Trypanosoma rangeli]|uniref:Uncharacterized protein n=1 Tax=Trypanosoma rangeli TaxID=5698 RepID=A0A422N2C4_TRYRA|nr:uncharacterized protein TraAM80_08099 [Trypanosoma rangeli]RNE99593.1 hypothetical protein TraAM80_08099 [Trypanosoma rangeli]|eukprot:RNE99593.1 hypothetical protein TraAM80_08099 [Trypanosoma rangeli]